jgi:uncharacterized Zn finger protein
MAKRKTRVRPTSLTPAQLRVRAGETYFARGEAYFRAGAVRSLNVGPEGADAAVQGTRRYRVRLSMEDGELDFTCSCPLGRDDEFCKHAVAVGLAWGAEIAAGRASAVNNPLPQRSPEDALRARLLNLNKEELVAVLMERADEDERLMRRLTLMAAKQAPPDAAASAWKRAFDEALATDDYVDYRDAYDYMSGVDEVLDNLERLLRDGHGDQVVELSEYAMEEIEAALDHVDDSDG